MNTIPSDNLSYNASFYTLAELKAEARKALPKGARLLDVVLVIPRDYAPILRVTFQPPKWQTDQSPDMMDVAI